ncbi:MAG: nucleotidyltransferase family protein, partial [Methanosarcinales archaeon]
MLTRTRDLVFEFAKQASKFKVAYIFLFGSVAREEEDKRSDVDLLVVFETKKNVEDLKDKKKVSNLALDLEKKYDKNLQIVFTNKNFDGLDSYFLQQVLREGILLYANSFPIQIKNFKLESYSLISYSLKNLSKPDKMRVI